jgi:CheY-like chemotaxis protein
LSIRDFGYFPYCVDKPFLEKYLAGPVDLPPIRWVRKGPVGAELAARILIVDDHLAARTTIRSLLDWHGFQVCGEATNGKEAIERVIELKPEVILLDINMPIMTGSQAALEIRRIAPQVKILFFTIHEAPDLIARLRPFAHGFVSKSAAGTELIPVLSRLTGVSGNRATKATKSV